MIKPRVALTITDADPTGGTSIMADLKSFHSCGVYGMGVVTSIVAQNTLDVQHAHNSNHQWIDEQLDSVFNDTLSHTIKTGMTATVDTMETTHHYLVQHESIPYVIDPVMLAKSGDSLMDNDTKQNLQHTLLPLADVITPSLLEAEEITGLTIDSEEKIMQADRIFISEIGSKGVIIKGNHPNDTDITKDCLSTDEGVQTFENERFKTKHTYGTGHTFSAVVTAELTKGRPLFEAVHKAKKFISINIRYAPEVGRNRDPVSHFAYLKKEGLGDELSR